MNPVCTAEEIRTIDRRVIEDVGIPGMVLMERAGLKTAEVADLLLRESDGEVVAIFCGRGNNGGDGMVIGRELDNRGYSVFIYLFADPKTLKGDALHNYKIVQKLGLPVTVISTEKEVRKSRISADLIVDALLGTGITGPVKGLIAKAVQNINKMPCPVLAVDIPTGVNTDTGACPGDVIYADVTVTMGLLKRGLCLSPGREAAGQIIVADIGFPSSAIQEESIPVFQLDDHDIWSLLPIRDPASNKTQVGKVLIVAGSRGLTGAAALAAEGAMKAGAGLAVLAVPQSLNTILETKLTEAMTLPLPETNEGSLSLEAEEQISAKLSWASVVALGPGLSRYGETLELVRRLITKIRHPMVLDADALFAISPWEKNFPKLKAPVIITPHEGEFSRLMGWKIQDVMSDRIAAAQRAAELFNVIVLLKGAPCIIASPEGRVYINSTGNAGMASGGVGDALTGIIAGLLGQGLEPFLAAAVGAFLHGRAGDIVAEEAGEMTLIAGDLIEALAKAIRSVDPLSETVSD